MTLSDSFLPRLYGVSKAVIERSMAALLRKQLLLHEETKNRRKRSDCGHHKEKYIEDDLNQFKIRHVLTPFRLM